MIKVLLVDDELPALREMEFLLKGHEGMHVVGTCQTAQEAKQKVRELSPDCVFLDIGLPGVEGLELAEAIGELKPGVNIVFVTAYSDYALEAFKVHPLDYIVKPVDEKRFQLTVEHLIKQVEFKKKMQEKETRTVIRCMENFEIFTESETKKHIRFATRQVKEMFAYLISRYERLVSRDELIEQVFGGAENDKTVNLLHVTAYKMRSALEEIGAPRSSITIRGNYTLETAEGVCDYVDFMKFVSAYSAIDDDNIATAEAVADLYRGPFLDNEDYAWALDLRAGLELEYERLMLGIARYYGSGRKSGRMEKTILKLLKVNPLCEEGWQQLLDSCMVSGNSDKYKDYYEKYSRILREELGLEPADRYREWARNL